MRSEWLAVAIVVVVAIIVTRRHRRRLVGCCVLLMERQCGVSGVQVWCECVVWCERSVVLVWCARGVVQASGWRVSREESRVHMYISYILLYFPWQEKLVAPLIANLIGYSQCKDSVTKSEGKRTGTGYISDSVA